MNVFPDSGRWRPRANLIRVVEKKREIVLIKVPRSNLSRRFLPAIISTLALSVLITACATGHPSTASTGPAVSITASPVSITAGSSATLNVVASDASAVGVTGSDGSTYTLTASGGTQSVSPTTTTTYTVTATGTTGKTTASTTLTVAPNLAPVVTIAASPTSVVIGNASALTLTATNTTQLVVTGSDGSTYTLPPGGGTQSVSPTATTTFTATATGPQGKSSATATVTVTPNPLPAISMSASPTTVNAGSPTVLTVSASKSAAVSVTGSDGSAYRLNFNGGTLSVSPASTTTYTATSTNSYGTSSATATVAVIHVPTVVITANPTAVTAGSSSILTVSADNSTGVTIAGSDGSTYTLSATGGTQPVSPSATTTYTATATGPNGSATAAATLTVTPNPAPSVSITANPVSITSGSSSSLTVSTSYATSVTISGSDGSTYSLPTASGGLQTVSPTSTTTYTATATGAGGTTIATAIVTVVQNPPPTVTIAANPTTVSTGNPATLNVSATNATQVTITGSDNSAYTLLATGGAQTVTPASTTTYTATATGLGGTATTSTTVTVTQPGSIAQIDHVIFMLQENHSFDNYFGMLNPYRVANSLNVGDDGHTYTVDGIDDKLSTSNQDDEHTSYQLFKFNSTCVDDMSSDWLASFGDVNRYDFSTTRSISMTGFVHNAEGYAKSCAASGSCSGTFTDLTGQRSMGYYDQGFLNYYYYMASQFAVSDRWFSPMASKSIDNRIATFSGGTTQGLVKDPGGDDHLSQLVLPNIFKELDQANVSWKIYYTVTQGFCQSDDDCGTTGYDRYPATDFNNFTYSYSYVNLGSSGSCTPPTQPSSVVGDSTNSFCIDPTHIAPISTYFTDLANGTLPSFAFIEAGYANNDEHPGSGQSILAGQAQVAKVVNALMTSPSWSDSVFFLSYDEGGGPFDHVPPVPGHTNDFTDGSLGTLPDISSIAVNPDSYFPCLPTGGVATTHCDLSASQPGTSLTDAATVNGFAAQLGFRVPNAIISPFTRRHYVSHTPIDHTAVIKFVENRFIGASAHLTARDAAQPDLLEFFDFTGVPWATPPTPPAPVTQTSLGYNPCTPATM
jgi:phospholipase C